MMSVHMAPPISSSLRAQSGKPSVPSSPSVLPTSASQGPFPKADPTVEVTDQARERRSTRFPPRVDTQGCSPGSGCLLPITSASDLGASGTTRSGKGTSPAQPQPGLQLARRTEPARPPASTQTLQRGMQPRLPHSQTAPIFLQEPSSLLQLAFLEIPLLLATKTLFSLFPCNSRGSMANIFLQAAQLSYKTAQAAHTPGAAPAACPHYNWFGFPSGVKSDRTKYYISLGHSRHNVKQTRASKGRRRWVPEHCGSFSPVSAPAPQSHSASSFLLRRKL